MGRHSTATMSRAQRARLAGELRQVCMRISRRARFENTDTLAPHQFSALATVERGVTSPGELAEQECVSAPSMSRTIGCLVDAGYLQRTRDPDDGRQVVLALTDAGRQVIRDTRRSRDAWMIQRVQQLTDAECAVLADAREILVRVAAR